MRWSDCKARRTDVLLNGVKQHHVVEAVEGSPGTVRKMLRCGDRFVMDFSGSRVAEVVEYGEVKLVSRGERS